MLALCIETSCDETSLALITVPEVDKLDLIEYVQKVEVVSDIVSSQIKVHVQYGGVVPEIGAREHAKFIHQIFTNLLDNSGEVVMATEQTNKLSHGHLNILRDIDFIFVTTEPGLVSALRVGNEFGKSLKFFLEKQFNKTVDIYPVNHLKGHLTSSLWQPKSFELKNETVFPHLHLLVSGGNSQLILLESDLNWKIIGQTLDDAAGECLDKIGRMVGLEYPGGVHVAKIAGLNDTNYLNFPVGMAQSQDLNFSYSGLKTAVRYHLQSLTFSEWQFEQQLNPDEVQRLISRSFDSGSYLEHLYKVCVSAQSVVVQQLISKVKIALNNLAPKSLGLSGGVSANLLLRAKLENLTKERKYNEDILFLAAPKNLTGDNAIMIGLAGIVEHYLRINKNPLSGQKN